MVFGSLLLGDAATLLGTGQPIELYTTVYVLLLPYALFRWRSGAEAVTGVTIVVVAHALLTAITGNFGDLAAGPLLLLLPAALGAAMRYRASSRLCEADEIKLREREQLARELHEPSPITSRPSPSAPRPAARLPRRAPAPPWTLWRSSKRPPRARSPTCGGWSERRDGEDADLAPQRGVDIERLFHAAADGPRVDVQLAGDLDDLRPLIDAAIYRIAQESVTDAVRHARRATGIDVRVTGDRDSVRVTVSDDGDGGASAARPVVWLRPRRDDGASRAARRQARGRPERRQRMDGQRRAAAGREGEMTVRVLVADDQELVRTGLRMILDAQPDIDVVARPPTGARRWPSPASSVRTCACSTSACRIWTASRRPGWSPGPTCTTRWRS